MPRPLSDLLMDDSFVRFLKGSASKEEETQWSYWMQQSKQHARLVEKGRELLNKGVYTLPKPNSDIEFDRLMSRIEPEIQSRSFKHTRKKSRGLVWALMAAAATVLLIAGFLARQSLLVNEEPEQARASLIEYKSLETESGQKTTIQYSDGSTIMLNANSKMKLPQKMTGADSMQVWLEGEALFDIARKADSQTRTFIVHTPNGKVSVLGTRFSVNTTMNRSQVVLSEGRVKINFRGRGIKKDIEYSMEPGEKALFSQDFENIMVEQVNTEVYTSWTSNRLIMDNTPLSDLINRIEFTYNVEVKLDNEALLDKKLTGRFNSSDLSFLLKGLSKMLGVDIDQQEQTVYIKEKTDSGNSE